MTTGAKSQAQMSWLCGFELVDREGRGVEEVRTAPRHFWRVRLAT